MTKNHTDSLLKPPNPTSVEFGDSIWQDTEKFDGNADFTIGAGIKATFYDDDKLKIGGLLQASWAKFDGELYASHWSAPDYVEISMAQVQIAVGPTYELNDHVSIYGGPFWHFIFGDLDVEVNEAVGGSILNSHGILMTVQLSALLLALK